MVIDLLHLKPRLLLCIHTLTVQTHPNKQGMRQTLGHSSQCMVGIKSDCVQVWRNSILLLHTCHNTPPPPKHTPPTLPFFVRVTFVF